MKEKSKQDFVSYANSFQTVINLGLERITALLNCAGNPQDKLSVIHVAGTNGKGSVCAFLQTMLTKSGKKTGKFISPNMIRVNERISIDGVEIADTDLNRLLSKIESYLPKVKAETGELPSQFEVWTAVAFCYFLERNCDVVVLETGLGGRFDATNVIKKPLCTVITRIAIDHVAYLGDTIAKIAYEKAGIIKENVPLVTLPQDAEAMTVLQDVAKEKNAPLFVTKTPVVGNPEKCYETFSYGDLRNLICGISGYHQIENASLAIETALQLNLSEDYIRDGLKEARHIGRLELVEERILFDGAHNLNGMLALKKSLDRYYPDTEKIFVSAFMKDKDIKESLAVFSGETFYFVSVSDNERSETPENLCRIGNESGVFGSAFSDLKTAISAAKETGKLIVVCGSLYLYMDLWNLIEKNKKK
ncbi:MAG: bifunctional folylpolyglutamate synthase/dihydrofolate synthase [Clostridia bacterium]|nr:bifunctional folylpolyglutamate synthase/dihydrofolate synthase [Clostridia bacterium]